MVGIGGQPLQVNQLSEADLDELATLRPTLTYGNASKPAPVEFVPAHVAFDKKVWLDTHVHMVVQSIIIINAQAEFDMPSLARPLLNDHGLGD